MKKEIREEHDVIVPLHEVLEDESAEICDSSQDILNSDLFLT